MIPATLLQGLFSKMIQGGLPFDKGEKKQAGGFAELLDRVTGNSGAKNEESLLHKLPLTGRSFLSQLKKEFMTLGRPLEDYTVGGDAVAQFGDILVGLGFDAGEVEEILSGLSCRGAGTVTLADLFNAASQLTEPGGDETSPAMLDVSALPGLEIIFEDLGLAPEKSRRILSEALVEGSGIDLEALVSGICRELDSAGDEPGIAVDKDWIIERISRMGLPVEENVSTDATPDEPIAEESVGADGLSGSLLLSYLQQLIVSLGSEGKPLRQLIMSSGKESGGVDGGTFLNRLLQMEQGTLVSDLNMGTTGDANAQAGTSDLGKMSLLRFASILENRIAAEEGSGQASRVAVDRQSTSGLLGSFMEKASTTVENTPLKHMLRTVSILESGIAAGGSLNGVFTTLGDQQPISELLGSFLEKVENTPKRRLSFQADPKDGKSSKSTWQPGSKAAADFGNPQSGGNASVETSTKEVPWQNTTQMSRPAVQAGDRPFSENPTGRGQPERFSHVGNTGGRNKTDKTADDVRYELESAVRATKSGAESTPSDRAAANRTLPSYLLNQVSRQIIRLQNAGENEIILQLKPPHLGRMKLTVEHTAGGMKVDIVVESAAAKEILLANTMELKTALGDQGLRLDRIDVEAQSNFGQSMAQAGRGFGQSGDQKGRWTGRGRTNARGVSETAPEVGTDAREVEPGRLDLVA